MFRSKTLNPNFQNRLLDFPFEAIGPKTKTKRSKGSLSVRGKERIDLIFQRLHGIIDIFLSLAPSIVLLLFRKHPLFGICQVFLVVLFCIRGQDFIDPVSWAPPVLTRSYIGNNLRDLSRCSLDGLRTFYFCIPNLKAISEHAFKINQTAVGHWCIRTIVQIMVVDVPFLVGIGYVFGQHFETNRLTNDPRRQVPLRIKDIAVLIRIFIPLRPISNVALSNRIFIGLKQFMFDHILDLINLHTIWKTFQNLCDHTIDNGF